MINFHRFFESNCFFFSFFFFKTDETQPDKGCRACPSGKRRPDPDPTCIHSAIGDLCPQTTCQNCLVGFFAGPTGMQNCTKCGAGKFASQAGSTRCTNCVAGMYR